MKNSAAMRPLWRFVLATKGRQYFAEMKEGRALLRFLPSLYFALSLENKGTLKALNGPSSSLLPAYKEIGSFIDPHGYGTNIRES